MIKKYQDDVAVFIDAENIHYKLIRPILERAKDYGTVSVKKAFHSNWHMAKKSLNECDNFVVDSIAVSRYVKGKSTVDFKMVIDALSSGHKDNIKTYVLCTSDTDFYYLAMELLALEKNVVLVTNIPKSKIPILDEDFVHIAVTSL